MDREYITTIDSEGHLDLPQDIRERHGLTARVRVKVEEAGNKVMLDRSKAMAQHAIDYILSSQVEIVYPTFEQTIQAATFNSGGGLSYADCYAAAVAVELGIPVLTVILNLPLLNRRAF